MHWSHMAGVVPEHRGGLGYRLKLEQRDARAGAGHRPDRMDLRSDADDERPLQLRQAGRRGRRVRGELLRRVDQRAAPRDADRPAGRSAGTSPPRTSSGGSSNRRSCAMRAQEVGEAPVVNTTVMDGKWRMVKVIDLDGERRGGCGSRSRPGSPRCSRSRRSARCSGACTCGRCSRSISRRAIARSISCFSARRLRTYFWPGRTDLLYARRPSQAARSSCARRARAGGCETPSGRLALQLNTVR